MAMMLFLASGLLGTFGATTETVPFPELPPDLVTAVLRVSAAGSAPFGRPHRVLGVGVGSTALWSMGRSIGVLISMGLVWLL